jgi:lipoic acid synthetase
MSERPLKKPDWIRVRLPSGACSSEIQTILRDKHLHTVCEEALCPNVGECWEHRHATIMILGDACSRHCRFCNVSSDEPKEPDEDEPRKTAEAVKAMGLKEAVITSVTRDDLKDGGESIWAKTIESVRAAVPDISVEVLVPDFKGNLDSIETVAEAKPDVFGHNLETVPSLYERVRPGADYAISLSVLWHAHRRGLITKTSFMLGLGETRDELLKSMKHARESGCNILFLGQYLQPSKEHLPVERYVSPEEFDEFKQDGLDLGFDVVVSAPLVRSSYRCDEQQKFLESL